MSNEEKIYCVYKHTNKINGKVYVGKTCANPPKRRWGNDGSGYIKSPLFWNAIQKYGWENFEHEILIGNLTEEEANDLEKKFIIEFKSNDRKFGYNLTGGGDGVRLLGEAHPRYGVHLDTTTKKKISDAHKKLGLWSCERNPNYGKHDFAGDGNPFYGKHHSEETKQKLSELSTGRPSPMKGKKFSNEARKNMKESGRKKCKPVLQFDADGVLLNRFDSAEDASRAVGGNQRVINGCCGGRNNTAYGYIWLYEADYDHTQTIQKKQRKQRSLNSYFSKPILQFTKDEVLVTEFISAVEASRQTNINVCCIRDCCKGRQKTAGGFIWRYKEDEENAAN